jgi:hypothetical protein
MKHIFSFGYRCSSAGILKYLKMKHESYPFDWLISRLPIVKDCIETDFQHFLNKENYEKRETQTIHYGDTANNNRFVCNETILYNTYYQEKFSKNELLIPDKLQLPNDTYAYHLALNHRNILCDTDYEYFERCIERFKKIIQSPEEKMYLYIHPVLSISEYELKKEELINQLTSFQEYMSSITSLIKGLFIIVVRTNFDHPVINHLPKIIEKIEITEYVKDCSIYILYTHKNFIDAGEIFMQQNYELETNALIQLVQTFVNSNE